MQIARADSGLETLNEQAKLISLRVGPARRKSLLAAPDVAQLLRAQLMLQGVPYQSPLA